MPEGNTGLPHYQVPLADQKTTPGPEDPETLPD